MKSYLKMKVMSLAEEAKIISKEEKRWLRKAAANRAKQQDPKYAEDNFLGLSVHRRRDIRKEARSAHIAYSFLCGRSYSEIERFAHTEPDWKRVKKLVTKYADPHTVETLFNQWMAKAKANYENTLVIDIEAMPMLEITDKRNDVKRINYGHDIIIREKKSKVA